MVWPFLSFGDPGYNKHYRCLLYLNVNITSSTLKKNNKKNKKTELFTKLGRSQKHVNFLLYLVKTMEKYNTHIDKNQVLYNTKSTVILVYCVSLYI